MKILIVEDEPQVLEMLKAWIREGLGAKGDTLIGQAGSLAEALEWLLENEPDIVICNGLFPRGTVSERTLRNLREAQHWTVIWAIALTSHKKFALLTGDSRLMRDAQAMGVRAFLKPEGVSAAIKYVLQGAGKSKGRD